MLLETLQTAAIQVTPVIALIWAASRFLSPEVQVWLWRLVFLRLTVGLLLWPTVNVPVLPPVVMEYSNVDVSYVAPPEPFPIWQVLWFSGVVILGLIALKETWQVRRLVIDSEQKPETLPVQPAGNYRISDRAKVPMVIGLFRPTILVPRDLAETATPEELRMIVAHEQGHIAHGDLFWAWLIWAGRAAFFFHPLVWVAARCERFAREAAADRFAIEKSGADPHGYGQVLMRITLADPLTSSLSPAGLTMSDSYRFIYRRLETMKTFSKRPTLGRLISTGALCAITFGLLPAFNLVPAAAQAPLDSATEPIAYPASEDVQAVNQSAGIIHVDNKPAKKAQNKKVVLLNLHAIKPTRATSVRTARIVDVIAERAENAAPPEISVQTAPPADAPAAISVNSVPAIASPAPRPPQIGMRIAPAAPAPATAPQRGQIRFRVALTPKAPAAPQAAKLRYSVALPPQAPNAPRPAQLRYRVAVPAKAPSPPATGVRYRIALPDAAPAITVDPSAPAQIAAPKPATVRFNRKTSITPEGRVSVTLSRPAVESHPFQVELVTASTANTVAAPTATVTQAADVKFVGTEVRSAAPAKFIGTAVAVTQDRPAANVQIVATPATVQTINIRPTVVRGQSIQVTTRPVQLRTVTVDAKPARLSQPLTITTRPTIALSTRLNTKANVRLSTVRSIKLATPRLIKLTRTGTSRSVLLPLKKKN